MNFVYICKDGENEELKYSIRSLVKNCNVNDIWVIGGKPDWYVGNHIPIDQKYSKYKNAFINFKTIANASAISDDFVLMNDDFFIVKPITKIISYYNGTLQNKIDAYEQVLGRSSYVNRLKMTQDKLVQNKINNPLNYELHVPMKMSKNKFNDVLNMNHNLLYRSVYGNVYDDEKEEMIDVKVYQSEKFGELSYNYLQNQYPFLSTESSSFLYLKQTEFFKDYYTKTKYEK